MSFESPEKNKFENQTFPKESIVGYAHTLSLNGRQYDVYKLIHLVENIKQINLKLADFESKKIEKSIWTDNNEKKISPIDLLNAYGQNESWEDVKKIHPEWRDHIKRIMEADYNHPVLVYENDVIDGVHRLIKAIADKIEFIPAKIIEILPEEAIYKE